MLASLASLALSQPSPPSGRGDQRLDGLAHFPWSNLLVSLLPNHAVYHSTEALFAAVGALSHSCAALTPLNAANAANTTPAFRLAAPPPSPAANRTRVLLTFGIHGREYIASEVGLAFLSRLCDGSARTARVLWHTEFVVVPVLNVAGREKMGSALAHGEATSCSSMRKNENEVDLNRNFDIDWSSGSSAASDQDYRGPAPNSEPQTQLVDEVVSSFNPHLYIDVHSGDTTMMYPFSYKAEDSPDAAEQQKLALFAARKAFGSDCAAGSSPSAGCPQIGNAAVSLDPPYLASGTTLDYMYLKRGVKYAFTWEVYKGTRYARSATDLLAVGNQTGGHDAVVSAPLAHVEKQRRRQTQRSDLALQPQGAINLLQSSDMVLEDCFTYFNPSTASDVSVVTTKWSDALLAAAEFFIE